MRRSLILLLLSAFLFALPGARAERQDPQKPAEPDDVISLETNLVVLNVTVTDPLESYVSGLKAEDFKVFEDNSQQKILSFGFEETPFAIVILLDASGSMGRKLTLARAACGNFVERIRDGDVFSIYSFGGYKVRTLQDFTEVRDVPDAVWDLRPDGETPLYDGIVKAAEALSKRPERRRALLLVSDGVDTKSRASLDEALRKTIAASASVYAVNLSDTGVYKVAPRDNGIEVMKTLATKTGGRFFHTPGGIELREAFTNTVEELRRQYTITYESANDKFDGRWRAIEVRVGKPNLNIRTRQGYYARRKRG
jgi:Ca-activated chloride channel family protein